MFDISENEPRFDRILNEMLGRPDPEAATVAAFQLNPGEEAIITRWVEQLVTAYRQAVRDKNTEKYENTLRIARFFVVYTQLWGWFRHYSNLAPYLRFLAVAREIGLRKRALITRLDAIQLTADNFMDPAATFTGLFLQSGYGYSLIADLDEYSE